MRISIFISSLFVFSFFVSYAADFFLPFLKAFNSDIWAPGPVKPWMLKSCTDEVEKSAPLFGKFASDAEEQNIDHLCEDIKNLEESVANISGNCWIGNYKKGTAAERLTTEDFLRTAQNLTEGATKISKNPLPIFEIAPDLENFFACFPKLYASCS